MMRCRGAASKNTPTHHPSPSCLKDPPFGMWCGQTTAQTYARIFTFPSFFICHLVVALLSLCRVLCVVCCVVCCGLLSTYILCICLVWFFFWFLFVLFFPFFAATPSHTQPVLMQDGIVVRCQLRLWFVPVRRGGDGGGGGVITAFVRGGEGRGSGARGECSKKKEGVCVCVCMCVCVCVVGFLRARDRIRRNGKRSRLNAGQQYLQCQVGNMGGGMCGDIASEGVGGGGRGGRGRGFREGQSVERDN